MLAHRLATASSLILIFLAVLIVDEIWFAPWFPLWTIAVLTLNIVAASEIVGLLQRTSAQPSPSIVLGGVLSLVVANVAPHLLAHGFRTDGLGSELLDRATPLHILAWPMLAFTGVVMVAFLIQGVQFTRPGGTMSTLAGSILAIAYVGLLGSFIIQLRWLDGPYHGIVPLALLIATAKGADVGAYTLGRLAGRHKLWPRLSPKKTREGALGGLLFAILASVAVATLARRFGHPSLSLTAAIGFGTLVGVFAQLGDLMESMIKRDCQQKDASDTLPGFGGILDVVDSLLFAGPVAYGYWLLFGP